MDRKRPTPPPWRPPGADTGDVSMGILLGGIGTLALIGLVTCLRWLWLWYRG